MVSGVLIAVAAPVEASAVLRAFGSPAQPPPWTRMPVADAVDLVVTGVGKANAAGAVARVVDAQRHRLIVSLGIAGALPAAPGAIRVDSSRGPLALGALVVATESVYADEGLESSGAWTTVEGLGFPLAPSPMRGNAVPGDAASIARLRPHADALGPIATVSTCSGTDSLATRVVARTGAIAEAMEGAAVGQVACRLGLAFVEVRAISNTTGDRPLQRWEVRAALDRLTVFVEAWRALGMP